jgi:hypothetical protein
MTEREKSCDASTDKLNEIFSDTCVNALPPNKILAGLEKRLPMTSGAFGAIASLTSVLFAALKMTV